MQVEIYNNSLNTNPRYETPYSAGMDIRVDFSRISPENPVKIYGDGEIVFAGEGHTKTMLRLEPNSRALLPTGIYLGIPEGYEIQLRPRSGLAIKKGLNLINCTGTIDADYKSEVKLPVVNQGLEAIWIEDGERVAQAILNKVEQIEWKQVSGIADLSGSDRGGGFGHTGSK